MSNSYFRFKQFTVHQDKAAMKVCTDACLFAAWVAQKITALQLPCNNILDIGCGTGVLSLMLAQKTTATVDAVEIDKEAAVQAAENFRASTWKDRLNVINRDIKNYKAKTTYDLIISNPPFFENDLLSPDERKNNAKHNSTLSIEELLSAVENNLNTRGHAAILLPYQRSGTFEKQAAALPLYVKESVHVKQTPTHSFFRSLLLLSKEPQAEIRTSELIIHDKERQYSVAFTELLRDYYLNKE